MGARFAKWLAQGGQPGTRPLGTGRDEAGPGPVGWTPPVYAERGLHMTGIGYTGASAPGRAGRAPMILNPAVDYVAVGPGPPMDRVWQGFQKENALALLQYGSRHPGMGPAVPGTDPPASVYDRNPMQLLSAKLATTQKVPAGVGAVGPGLDWMPNPTSPTASQPPPGAPSLVQTIMRRLFGG